MGDIETKFKRSKHRKQNLIAKALRDQGERKGAFGIRILDPKKEYKREKMKANYERNIEDDY